MSRTQSRTRSMTAAAIHPLWVNRRPEDPRDSPHGLGDPRCSRHPALALRGRDHCDLLRNRSLRTRHGDIPVRVRRPGKKHWIRGHAIWVSDVFVWRGSPAAWNEDVSQVSVAALRTPDSEDLKKLHRLAGGPAIARLSLAGGESLDVATAAERKPALLGPFGRHPAAAPRSPSSAATQSRATSSPAPTTDRRDR